MPNHGEIPKIGAFVRSEGQRACQRVAYPLWMGGFFVVALKKRHGDLVDKSACRLVFSGVFVDKWILFDAPATTYLFQSSAGDAHYYYLFSAPIRF